MKPIFTYYGKVIAGKSRGKILGFPTANIKLHKKIPEGVYISYVIIKKTTYQAATFVGSAKTFSEAEYKSESYILNFDRDIYGEWVSVHLLKKLRGNMKFSSKEALVTQIKKDVLATLRFFQ